MANGRKQKVVILTVKLGIGPFSNIREVGTKGLDQAGAGAVDTQTGYPRKQQQQRNWAQANSDKG